MPPAEDVLTGWYDAHRSFLWGVCYRITGSAADAEDVVQDTFIRAVQHAPASLENPRRWLTRVAINAARDVLRRRKRQRYAGPWLPTPIETVGDHPATAFESIFRSDTIEHRYDLLESASLAFLHALEALGPTQRAVLLLRDVFDYSAAEVAAVLEMSEGNVRTTHHRARRLVEGYDRRRVVPTSANRARTADALRRFLHLLTTGDVLGIEQMLAADVKAVTDGGGHVTAAQAPITGVASVSRFFARLAASRAGCIDVAIRTINHFPAAVLDFSTMPGRRPTRLVFSLTLDEAGAITDIRVIANPDKLVSIDRSRARASNSTASAGH